MNKLINVTLNENQEPVVSGRQLHQVLGVKTAYKEMKIFCCSKMSSKQDEVGITKLTTSLNWTWQKKSQ